jgi:hypothetical protein
MVGGGNAPSKPRRGRGLLAKGTPSSAVTQLQDQIETIRREAYDEG